MQCFEQTCGNLWVLEPDEYMQAISGLNQNLRSNVLNDPETFPW